MNNQSNNNFTFKNPVEYKGSFRNTVLQLNYLGGNIYEFENK